jgi:hypothetical protein
VIEHYIRLARLAEAERDHAVAGRIEDVLAMQRERATLIEALPAKAPAEAHPFLHRAAAAQAETTVVLGTALRTVRAEAVRLDQGRDAVAAYMPSSPRVPRVAAHG